MAMIGKRYGAAPAGILAANNLRSAEPVEGDRLLIPAVMRAQPAARKAASVSAARRRATSPAGRSKAAAVKSTAAKPATASPVILTRAAARYRLGDRVGAIADIDYLLKSDLPGLNRQKLLDLRRALDK